MKIFVFYEKMLAPVVQGWTTITLSVGTHYISVIK